MTLFQMKSAAMALRHGPNDVTLDAVKRSFFTQKLRRLVAITVFVCWGVPGLLNGQVQRTFKVVSTPNNGVALPGGPTIISGPASGPNQFYRLLIRER